MIWQPAFPVPIASNEPVKIGDVHIRSHSTFLSVPLGTSLRVLCGFIKKKRLVMLLMQLVMHTP
jgi:hypothetical protein